MGGVEPLPVDGHLGSGEPIVKPTSAEVGFLFLKGGGNLQDRNLETDKLLCPWSRGNKAILL